MNSQLNAIFNPRSVAIIGASRTRGKIGNEVLRNIVYGGYRGAIFPVNPSAESIMGVKTYSSVAEILQEVDLAVVVVPAQVVPQVVSECADKNVKAIVILSAGFSEIGRHELEEEVKRRARGIKILGPNTVGIINTSIALNATFLSCSPPKGSIALITQSGAVAEAAGHWAAREKIGLSKVVSVGNKCDIGDAELLEYLGSDKETKVVTMYIESLKDGRRFMEVAAEVSKTKPVLVLKAGKSAAGSRAAQSHTGSLAGEDRIYDAAFKQSRVIRIRNATELFDAALALSLQPPARANRIAIVTNAGGEGIMASDACEERCMLVPKFSDATVQKLRDVLPEIASPFNPVDVVGDADYERYSKVLDTVSRSNEIDAILFVHVQSIVDSMNPLNAVLKMKTQKPVVACLIGGVEVERGMRVLRKHGVPCFFDLERAVAAMGALVKRGEMVHEKSFNRGRG